jgi:hypothetical protein
LRGSLYHSANVCNKKSQLFGAAHSHLSGSATKLILEQELAIGCDGARGGLNAVCPPAQETPPMKIAPFNLGEFLNERNRVLRHTVLTTDQANILKRLNITPPKPFVKLEATP